MEHRADSAGDWLIEGGALGDLIRSMDWSATPLGSRDAWPQSLRTTVNLVVSSSFPMAILWGPDLRLIYNDAYRVIAADRHPEALGCSTREVWPEAWVFNEPIFERVMTLGETVHLEDQLFRLARHGRTEDTYFTLSYSPIRAEALQVAGTLVVLLDTTARLQLEHRMRAADQVLEAQVAASVESARLLSKAEAFGKIGAWECSMDTLRSTWTQGVYDIHEVDRSYNPNIGEGVQFYAPASQPIIERAVQRAIEHGEPFDVELDLITAKGNTRCVHAVGARDLAHRRIYGFFQDVTERRAAKAALQESEARYRAVAETATDAIVTADGHGRVVGWNPSAQQMFGRSESEMLGQSVGLLMPGQFRDRHEEGVQRLEAGGDPRMIGQVVELSGVRKDGTEFPLELSLARWTLSGGQFYTGIIRDVTERNRAEAALRRSEQRYRTLVEAIPNSSILLFDHEHRFLVAGGDEIRKSGFDKAAVEGHTLSEAFTPEVAALFGPLYERALKGEPSSFEHAFGDLYYFQQVVPMRDDRGEIFGGIVVSTNITERKRAEAEQAKLEAQFQQAQKLESVGRLAGGVAHDFNNMLGVILGHGELALEHVDASHPVHRHLLQIEKAAGHSAHLTNQLLAFARKQTVAPIVLDLNERIAPLLKMLERLIGEDIALSWHQEANLWPVKIDPTQVDQLLTNLCINARDAITGVGDLTIRTRNTTLDQDVLGDAPEAAPGDYVVLAVSDTGRGMSPEVLARVFEPFFTTKDQGRGTGLGLATVHGIVGQNGGFVTASSEPGVGTTFEIHLPRCVGAIAEALSLAAADTPRASGETVLLVEDEPAILELTIEVLERQGYTVLDAGSPGEALRLARDHDGAIHLLVTDVVMPAMNGLDLVAQVAAIRPGIKSLFMSGYTADILAERGVLEADVHFIPKPFSRRDLAVKVRRVLDSDRV